MQNNNPGVHYFNGSPAVKICKELNEVPLGGFTILFGLTLVIGITAIGLISVYMTATKCTRRCSKKNKILVTCLSIGILLGYLSIGLLFFSLFYSLPIGVEFYCLNQSLPECKDSIYYIAYTSLLLMHVPLALIFGCFAFLLSFLGIAVAIDFFIDEVKCFMDF